MAEKNRENPVDNNPQVITPEDVIRSLLKDIIVPAPRTLHLSEDHPEQGKG